MRQPTIHTDLSDTMDERPEYTLVQLAAVEQDDGNPLRGYIRLAIVDPLDHHEKRYLGSFSVAKLLRFADTIRRRHAAWQEKRHPKQRRNRP